LGGTRLFVLAVIEHAHPPDPDPGRNSSSDEHRPHRALRAAAPCARYPIQLPILSESRSWMSADGTGSAAPFTSTGMPLTSMDE